ncbi:MAG: hypothetical protein IRZ16_08465 [Myxococcaceae bacterium]|nr:hypothetical protein [Myxococcaceae bacterium]
MVAALLAAALLTAAPTSSVSTTSAAPSPAVLKLAAPGLEAVDVDPKKAQFLNDFLSEQAGRRSEGRIQVLTQSEVAALLGLERTKQLLGCSDEATSCLTEIAGALGADGLVVGNVAKFGDQYAMTIKVLGPAGGEPLFSASRTGMTESQLLDWVRTVSIDLVHKLDPGAPMVEQVTAPRVPLENHSLWLSLLGADLEWRLRGGPSWIGARVAVSGGKLLGADGFSANGQMLFMARYMPLPPGQKWVWSVYTGVGFGGIYAGRGFPDAFPFAATLGAEGGYQGLRASIELMYSNADQLFTVIPGLSVALTF